MNKLLIGFPLLLLAATPAHATGGMTCRTAGPKFVEVSMTIGHVAGSPLAAARLIDGRRHVPVTHAQWWLDQSELRLLLVDPQVQRQEALIRATRNGAVYDGSLVRNGKRRWIRCRES